MRGKWFSCRVDTNIQQFLKDNPAACGIFLLRAVLEIPT
jgi:hypothetical protein